MTASVSSSTKTRQRLPRTVWLLGWTSFFSDVSSEMVFPLLPLWLAGLGAGPTALGVLEGLAEAVASLMKYKGGQISDARRSRKPFVAGGYAIAALMRPSMALATAAWHVVAFRVVDRVGKGIRTAPRDALIAKSVSHEQLSAAFALQQGLDHAGALLGPLLATALLTQNWTLPAIFLASAIPGALSVVTSWVVDEPAEAPPTPAPAATSDKRTILPSSAVSKLLIAAVAFFAFGKLSDAFLLIRAAELGMHDASIPLIWAWLHLCKVGGSWLAAKFDLSNARKRQVSLGWALNAACILALVALREPWHLWLLTAFWGGVQGFFVPMERALIRQTALGNKLGTAYGIYHALTGVGALLCGLVVGGLWEHTGVTTACIVASALCLIGAACLAGATIAAPKQEGADSSKPTP